MARLEHHEPHFETESLNTLAHHNAELTPTRLEAFLNGLMATAIRPAIQAFAPAMAGTPAQMLRSADFSIFLKYLCSLRIQGDPHLNRYFGNVFNRNFKPASAPELLRRRPTSPLYPVYFGMREEFADQGINGRELAEETANAFARFAVMATQNQPVSPSTGAGEIFKQDFKAVLNQFPFAQKLARAHNLDEQTVERELGNIKPADLVALLAYLRMEITTERARGTGGIKFGQVSAVQDFLSHVEAILANKIAAKLADGESPEQQGWSKVPNVTASMLLRPLAENLHRGRSGMFEHLKHVKVEHAAHAEGGEAGHTVHDVVAAADTVQTLIREGGRLIRWLSRAKKGVDEVVPPTGRPRSPH